MKRGEIDWSPQSGYWILDAGCWILGQASGARYTAHGNGIMVAGTCQGLATHNCRVGLRAGLGYDYPITINQ